MRILVQYFLLSICLLFGSQLYGQLIPTGYDTTAISHEILLDAGADYYGSSVRRDLLSKFIRGGYITNEIKENSFNKHKAVNRLGAVGFGEIEYRNYNKKLFKKKDWGYLIKGGYNVFGGLLYSKDLFGLTFYGNQPYMGETMDLSGANAEFMVFQKIGFGGISEKTKSSISFYVYNISNRLSVDLREVELTQDLAGDSIQITMDGEVETTNSKSFSQGIGFGFDFDFKVPVNWGKERQAFLQFQAKNVGFAYLYEKQKVYAFDTSFTFDGFTFDQIIGENAIFGDSLKILDSLGIRSSEKSKAVLLPGFIQIGKIVDEHYTGQLQSFFGVRLYPTLIYSPYVYVGMDYHPAKWLRLGVNASYGGFGGFRGGLYSNFTFGNYSLGLATENVVGFFSKKAGTGQSLFIKLRCAL